MHTTRMKHLRYLTTAGIFAALIFVTTYFLHINIPFTSGGYIHPGDTLIYLAACMLPMPYAAAAASIGAALSDSLAGPIYIPATLVIKAVLTLFFTRKSKTFLVKRNVIGIFLAGIAGLAGYFLWESICFGVPAALANIPMGSIQPIMSGVFFVLIGFALDKTNFKKRFQFD